MSENEWYLEGKKPSLGGWIFQQMAMGAVYAAMVFFGVIAIVLIFVAIGSALPERAREAPDPTPWSSAPEAMVVEEIEVIIVTE